MNPRQRRGVFLMGLSVLAAILVFIGVSSYVSNVNSKVGPMVTVYHVTKDLQPFTKLSSDNTEPVEVPAALGPGQHRAEEHRDRRPSDRHPAGGRVDRSVWTPWCRPAISTRPSVRSRSTSTR